VAVDPKDVRVLVPRIRRAVEGAGVPPVLSDDALKDVAADAIAAVILYSGSVFGKQLVVTHVDDATGAPDEYATSDPLTLEEGTVIAAQAALDYFFHRFSELKVQEQIADEAQTWEYTLSANLIRDQLKLLVEQRDKALDAIKGLLGPSYDSYASFLATRDSHTSVMIEPWVHGSGLDGQEVTDFRFGMMEVPVPIWVGP
jgi:hypothetical protein